MSVRASNAFPLPYSLVATAPHTLHDCRDAQQFCERFEAATGMSALRVADQFIDPAVFKAVFLVGSIPLGMATSASDIDFIVLVDSKDALSLTQRDAIANSGRQLAFSNESNALAIASFVTLTAGIAVEVQVVLSPMIGAIHRRLRARGPELSESEIMTLSRLATGWMLWESDGYLRKNAVEVRDPALDIYCSTRNFVSALIFRRKAESACEQSDIPLAFHLGRSSVEMSYLAYFASEGISYLGGKWPAQIGQARDAAERVTKHPLLKGGINLLFPKYIEEQSAAAKYLQTVSDFLSEMRNLIEQKTLFRIAFNACPQIHPL